MMVKTGCRKQAPESSGGILAGTNGGQFAFQLGPQLDKHFAHVALNEERLLAALLA
jgi:hypothetical protein